jgi:hypothetical protein
MHQIAHEVKLCLPVPSRSPQLTHSLTLHPPPPTQARDPIPQLKRFMLEQGLASEDDIKAIHDK